MQDKTEIVSQIDNTQYVPVVHKYSKESYEQIKSLLNGLADQQRIFREKLQMSRKEIGRQKIRAIEFVLEEVKGKNPDYTEHCTNAGNMKNGTYSVGVAHNIKTYTDEFTGILMLNEI